ncbi:MAG: hypothetical protein ABI388_06325 [Bacteroidia bacterium]
MKRLLHLKHAHFTKRNIFLFLLLIVSSFSSFSQSKTSSPSDTATWVNSEHTSENLMGLKQGWFIGGDAGTTLFYGDVALYNNFPKFKDFSKSFGRGLSVYGGKKFKFGLAAEAQAFYGTLQGQKVAPPLYQRYFKGDVLNYSVSLKYNLSQLFFRNKQDRKFFNRLAVYATVGFGQAFYRSRLYKLANNNQWYLEKATGYSTSGIDSAGPHSAGGLVDTKTKMQSAFILPVGGKINYKLNKKTDIVLDFYYVTVFADNVDSWSRSWSHKDKYFYTGIGLCYNFGRGDDDELPYNQRILRPHDKKGKATVDINSADIDMPATTGSISKGSSKRKSKNAKEDKDLEVKLKLYELQLKLFEMQFLIQ